MPNLIQNPEDIRINEREEIQHMLGNPPTWMMRWGITMIFVVVLVVLTISWIVKYPDLIEAKAILTTSNPPIRVIARVGGKISKLLVADKESVEEGKPLAILENTANWTDVLALEKFVQAARSGNVGVRIPENLQLGDLQTAYSNFSQTWKELAYYVDQNPSAKRIANLQSQIEHLHELNKSLERQKIAMNGEKELSLNELQRNKQLFASGAISQSDLEKMAANYSAHKRQVESIQTQIINNEIQEQQLEGQILDLRQSKNDTKAKSQLSIQEDIQKLASAIDAWKQAYMVTAPIKGKVSMSRIWSAQQFVQANEEVMTIVPEEGAGAGKVFVKAILPIANAGKVRTDMRVSIRINGYNYQEFGTLEGRVSNISLVPMQENYILEIELDHPDLTTTYNKKLEFRQEMQGICNIITKERRVIERIFEKFFSVMKNK